MEDKEIIKALECCTSWGCGTSCADCPLYNTGCLHFNKLGETLDLINRQQAEIERLSKKNEELAEILSDTIKIRYAEAKAEAIKEFAERLKENTIDVDVSYGYGREHYTEAVAVIEIDNLIKEMVGEDK